MKKLLTLLLLAQLSSVVGMQERLQTIKKSCCAELCCASSLALSLDGLYNLGDTYSYDRRPECHCFSINTPLRLLELGCAAACLYKGAKLHMQPDPDHLDIHQDVSQKGWQDSYEQLCCGTTCRVVGEDLSVVSFGCCAGWSEGQYGEVPPMIGTIGLCCGGACIWIGTREYSTTHDHCCMFNKCKFVHDRWPDLCNFIVSCAEHRNAQPPHAQHMD